MNNRIDRQLPNSKTNPRNQATILKQRQNLLTETSFLPDMEEKRWKPPTAIAEATDSETGGGEGNHHRATDRRRSFYRPTWVGQAVEFRPMAENAPKTIDPTARVGSVGYHRSHRRATWMKRCVLRRGLTCAPAWLAAAREQPWAWPVTACQVDCEADANFGPVQ